MPHRLTLLVACIIATSSSTPASAHHAFAAVFNGEEAVEVQGTVTKLEWMNPHTWFYVAVDGDDDTTEIWAFEMGSPNGLVRRGWSRHTLQVGQEVKVSGYRAKDGTEAASVKTVVFADGQQLSGASSKGERQ
jgi:hypothetical protein